MSTRDKSTSRIVCWLGIACLLALIAFVVWYIFSDGTHEEVHNYLFEVSPLPTHPVPGHIDKSSTNPVEAERKARNLVDKINSHPNRTWKAEVNPYAVSLTAADQDAFAYSNDNIDPEILKVFQEIQSILQTDPFTDLYNTHLARLFKQPLAPVPESFDVAERWPACTKSILQIHDQGGCGSCWAVAAASLITDRICIATNGYQKREISAQDLLECCFFCGSCNGTLDPVTPFFYWYQHGIHTADCYPYTIARDCGYPCMPQTFINPHGLGTCRGKPLCRRPREQAKYIYKIGSLANDKSPQRTLADVYADKFEGPIDVEVLLKRDILAHGPAVLCFNVFEGFMHYQSGVYSILADAAGSHIYDHCVKIVGWGQDALTGRRYLKANNSWSTHWAINGTFLIDIGMLRVMRSDLYAGIPRL